MSDFDDVNKLLDELINNLHSQDELNKLGLAGIRKIQDRTRKGEDVEGRPFKPYSDKYAEKRKALGLPTHIVNLTLDDIDGMLHKVDHTITNDLKSVELDITDPEKRKIASYHDQLGVAKAGENIRHFWDLNKQDEKDITDLVKGDIENLLSDLIDEYNAR